MKKQSLQGTTQFGENLQFSLITEGFQSHFSFGKTFSFSSKTEGSTNFSVRLKQKVFQQKPSFFLQDTKRKLNRTEENTRSRLKGGISIDPYSGTL